MIPVMAIHLLHRRGGRAESSVSKDGGRGEVGVLMRGNASNGLGVVEVC